MIEWRGAVVEAFQDAVERAAVIALVERVVGLVEAAHAEHAFDEETVGTVEQRLVTAGRVAARQVRGADARRGPGGGGDGRAGPGGGLACGLAGQTGAPRGAVQGVEPQHQGRRGVGFVVVPRLPGKQGRHRRDERQQVGSGGCGLIVCGGQAERGAGGIGKQAGGRAWRQVPGVGTDEGDGVELAAARVGKRGDAHRAVDRFVAEAGGFQRAVEPAPPLGEAVFFAVGSEVAGEFGKRLDQRPASGVGGQRRTRIECVQAGQQAFEPDGKRRAGTRKIVCSGCQACEPVG